MSLDTILKNAERLALQQPPQARNNPAHRHHDPVQAFKRIRRFCGEEENTNGVGASETQIMASDRYRVAIIPNQCKLPPGIYKGRIHRDSLDTLVKALAAVGSEDTCRSSWLFNSTHLRAAAKCAISSGGEQTQVRFSPLPGEEGKLVLTVRGQRVVGGESTGEFAHPVGPVFFSREDRKKGERLTDPNQHVSLDAKHLVEALMGLAAQAVVVEVDNSRKNRVVKITRHDGEIHWILPNVLTRKKEKEDAGKG